MSAWPSDVPGDWLDTLHWPGYGYRVAIDLASFCVVFLSRRRALPWDGALDVPVRRFRATRAAAGRETRPGLVGKVKSCVPLFALKADTREAEKVLSKLTAKRKP